MGVLLYGVWRPWKERGWKLYLLIVCWVFVSAGADEFHQLFIPGRAGMIQDLGVDALGFLPCIAITFLVTAWLRHKAAKTQQ
jgi:VanZ family protein